MPARRSTRWRVRPAQSHRAAPWRASVGLFPIHVLVAVAVVAHHVGAGLAGFVIGARHHFAQHAGGEELHRHQHQQHADHQQRPGADVVAEKNLDEGEIAEPEHAETAEDETAATEEMAGPAAETHEEIHHKAIAHPPAGAADALYRLADLAHE